MEAQQQLHKPREDRVPSFGRSDTVDKVNRYGWDLRDEPGELVLIPKEQLVVDHEYQRPANEVKILALASSWSWLACGVIIVANRRGKKPGGQLFIVDGQHRVRAAMKRSDIQTLPCLVFHTKSAEVEAAGFLAANTLRKPLDGISRFRALLTVGDPGAIAAERFARSAGRSIALQSGPTSLACVSALMSINRDEPEALARIWPLVAAVCMGQPFHERILRGLVYLETHMPEGESLTALKWTERVTRIGYDSLLDGANKAAVFYSRGGAKTWAKGMQQVINHGLRNRLVLNNEIDDENDRS